MFGGSRPSHPPVTSAITERKGLFPPRPAARRESCEGTEGSKAVFLWAKQGESGEVIEAVVEYRTPEERGGDG